MVLWNKKFEAASHPCAATMVLLTVASMDFFFCVEQW